MSRSRCSGLSRARAFGQFSCSARRERERELLLASGHRRPGHFEIPPRRYTRSLSSLLLLLLSFFLTLAWFYRFRSTPGVYIHTDREAVTVCTRGVSRKIALSHGAFSTSRGRFIAGCGIAQGYIVLALFSTKAKEARERERESRERKTSHNRL